MSNPYKRIPEKDDAYSPNYKPAIVRDQERTQESKKNMNPLVDPTADKYDYVIVFNKIKREKLYTVDSLTGRKKLKMKSTEAGESLGCFEAISKRLQKIVGEGIPKEKRVYWGAKPAMDFDSIVASDEWYNAIPGETDRKNKAVLALKQAWMDFTGNDEVYETTSIEFSKFLELTRNHIIDILMNHSGLQLKLSSRKRDANGETAEKIFCRIRAPISLLEKRADDLDYKLMFRPEVDPGTEFWSVKNKQTGAYEEIEADAKLIESKGEAAGLLETMYENGHISPNDVQIFEDEPTPKHWSRRIRTLERIADKVPVSTRMHPYANFTLRPTERHLFMEYPSVRGSTLFRSKDRLYITDTILSEHFDFPVLKSSGIIDSIFPLHDSNFGEALTTSSFNKTWIFPWRADKDKVGGPYVSHEATDRKSTCPLWWYPWAQPHMEIREYFGEKLALYFGWLGYYGVMLIYPSLVGIALQIYLMYGVATNPDSANIKVYMVLYATFIVLWATAFTKGWGVEEKKIAVLWGTEGFEDTEGNRPQFQGDRAESFLLSCFFGCNTNIAEPRRLSAITLQMETYYPPEKRAMKENINNTVIFFLCVLVVLSVIINSYIEAMLINEGLSSIADLLSLESAIQIRVLSYFYRFFVKMTCDWENHQTDTAYEDSKIIKTFVFECFNNYGSLMFTAFAKRYLFGCPNSDCISGLQTILIAIFLMRYLTMVAGTIAPWWVLESKRKAASDEASKFGESEPIRIQLAAYMGKSDNITMSFQEDGVYTDITSLSTINIISPSNLDLYISDFKTKYNSPKNQCLLILECQLRSFHSSDIVTTIEEVKPIDSKTHHVFDLAAVKLSSINVIEAGKSAKLSEVERFEYEYQLSDYEDLFDNYATTIKQLGFVAFFSMAWSFIPLVALVEVLLYVRGVAFQFCNCKKRPVPEPAEDIGAWMLLMEAISVTAILINSGIICFSTHALDSWSHIARFLAWLIMEHCILAVRSLLSVLMPSEPDWLRETVERQKFVVDRHRNIKTFDDAGSSSSSAPSGYLDADNLNLAEAAGMMTEFKIAKVEYLKERMRIVEKDLDELRKNLKKASSGEIWNEDTLVSESTMVPGLALGMVHLTILGISGVGTPSAPLVPEHTRVVISIRDVTKYDKVKNPKPYEGAPGPTPIVTRKGKEKIRNGNVTAEIKQEHQIAPIKCGRSEIVLDIVDDSKKKKRGTATIALSQLSDQKLHERTPKILPKGTRGESTEGSISIKVQFQYSKIKPIKEQMYSCFERKRKIEKDITNITIDRELENEWDFPS